MERSKGLPLYLNEKRGTRFMFSVLSAVSAMEIYDFIIRRRAYFVKRSGQKDTKDRLKYTYKLCTLDKIAAVMIQ